MSSTMKIIAFLSVVLALPAVRGGEPSGGGPSSFSDVQLEQMAAPVALYPDALLTQVLMGATYPLEIVEADRWLASRPGLSGRALDDALKTRDWDPSVKSLCTFRDLLARMSANLDWTKDLGDAFLGQQSQLLDAVQRLRRRAVDAGQLRTTAELRVTVKSDGIIVVVPADPVVVAVPVYSPVAVYGVWPYPTTVYAPLYVPPPPGATVLAFAAGVAVGAALWGECHWGFGHSECHIDIDHFAHFERNTVVIAGSRQTTFVNAGDTRWRHDPAHRGGIRYRDEATAARFRGADAPRELNDARARGRAPAPNAAPGPEAGRRNDRPATSGRGTPSGGAAGARREPPRGGAFEGAGDARLDRAASRRGAGNRGQPGEGNGPGGGRH